MDREHELRLLRRGPGSERDPEVFVLEDYVVADCPGDAPAVLGRSKEVLRTVVERSADSASLEEWRSVLPAWFVAASAEEKSLQEAERWVSWWQSLPEEEKLLVSEKEPWSLGNWLAWLVPHEEREWYWWDGKARDRNTVTVSLQPDDWPVPWGSLKWLLRASGARSVCNSF